jgi:hypothetical protein
MNEQSAATPEGMRIRQAGIEDLDAFVDIALASLSTDAQWDYRYPHRNDFPEDHRAGLVERWKGFFSSDPTGNEYKVYIVDYQPEEAVVMGKHIPIAVSAWRLPPRGVPSKNVGDDQQSGKIS